MRTISLLALMAASCMAAEPPDLKPHPFNGDWQFALNTATSTASTAWQAVTLPHTAQLAPLLMGDKMWMGECLYRKVFTADPAWQGKRVCLIIEAAMHTAEISLNGKPLASHAGGYLPFQLDLSGLLNHGAANELLIKLDNRENTDLPPGKPYRELDFSWYHGLYRNVELRAPTNSTSPIRWPPTSPRPAASWSPISSGRIPQAIARDCPPGMP
ncbi:MAG: hypothetical protein NTW21_21335 [Verrucomicrobia bacterium]|nr:hypothetical protein [Verrucomicrobiota bacterium]